MTAGAATSALGALLAALAAALPPPPARVELPTQRFGTVVLEHPAHLARRTPCASCHGEGPIGKLSPMGEARGHAVCRGCHERAGRGPLRCLGCHEVARPSGRPSPQPPPAAPAPPPAPAPGAARERAPPPAPAPPPPAAVVPRERAPSPAPFRAAPLARGPVLALRAGVAPALGSAVRDVPMSEATPVHYPLQLDLLWAFGPVAAGAYGSWGPGRAGDCDPGATCSAAVTRAGLQATWTFSTGGRTEPWVGLSTGYEWAAARRSRGGRVTTRLEGFEPLAIQGGLEWRLGRHLALGPVALAGLGRYRRMEVETPYDARSAEVARPAFHGWAHLGVRARLVAWGRP